MIFFFWSAKVFFATHETYLTVWILFYEATKSEFQRSATMK